MLALLLVEQMRFMGIARINLNPSGLQHAVV